jgi:hypothetical protein
MPDLPISGLPAVTTLSGSFITAVVSGSVTSQMTVKQIGDAYSSSISTFPYTGSARITGSLGVTGSLSVSGSITVSSGSINFMDARLASTLSATLGVGSAVFDPQYPNLQATNLFFGVRSLQNLTTGSGNIAVGENSMSSSIAEIYDNVAIGTNTLIYLAVSGGLGNSNTAVGTNAGSGLRVGTYNTFTGDFAGIDIRSGSYNTFVGHNAGSYILTGSYNTIIGKATGSSTLNNTILIADGQGNVGYKYSGSRAEITGSISQTSVTSSLIKANANGTLVAAVGGTDYTPPAYLSAFHTASLTVPSPNTPNTMSFSTVDFAQGVTVSGSWSDKIKMTNGGIYNLQFSAATTKTTGTTATVDIWLRKNESDLSYTNTIVTLAGGSNDFAVPAWNFFLSASAGDYYQLMFASPTTNPYIAYAASGSTGVAVQVPSLILTVNRVG